MLKNTLILPGDDGQAAQLLRDAINDLKVILMIIVGPQTQWVNWADQLADKGSGNGLAGSFRHVVWIQTPPGAQVSAVLQGLTPSQQAQVPSVVVLNFADFVCDTIGPADQASVDPMRLEEAFLKGNL